MTESQAKPPAEEETPAALLARAESIFYEGGRLEDAEKAIRSALKLSKDKTWRYYFIFALICEAQKRTHDAMFAFRHVLSLAPLVPAAHWRFGEFLLHAGELLEAEAEIRRAISISPKNGDYHASLGSVLIKYNLFDDALQSVRRAIRLGRKNPRARIVLGELRAAQGNYRGAEKALAKALALAPKSRHALGVLSKILAAQGKTDEAIACTKKLLELDPNNPKAHIRISNQYKQAGRFEEAEQVLKAGAALQASDAESDGFDDIVGDEDHRTEEVAAMSAACRLDPENEEYRVQLAKLISSNAVGVPGPNKGPVRAMQGNLLLSTGRRLIDTVRLFWRGKKGM